MEIEETEQELVQDSIDDSRRVIDYELAEKLANMQCNLTEMAKCLGCTTKTFNRNPKLREIYESGIEKGRVSLRRAQMKNALNGDSRMQIWLGKQYLGQSEKLSDASEDKSIMKVEVFSKLTTNEIRDLLAKENMKEERAKQLSVINKEIDEKKALNEYKKRTAKRTK